MTDRQIQCGVCSTDLGTIRDARLRKDISYTCGRCKSDDHHKIRELERQIRAMHSARAAENLGKKDDGFANIFGDFFK
jgi:hypothetical protein